MKEMPATAVAEHTPEQLDRLILNEYQQSNSILGHIGRFVEPVMQPMEMGWKSCVSLIAGSAAKEVVVSTLGVLYVGDDDAAALSQRLRTPSVITGHTPFTPASAMAFMVFVLLYFPCVATITAIRHETGSWKYPLFSVVYNTSLAWLLAFIAYHVMRLFT